MGIVRVAMTEGQGRIKIEGARVRAVNVIDHKI